MCRRFPGSAGATGYFQSSPSSRDGEVAAQSADGGALSEQNQPVANYRHDRCSDRSRILQDLSCGNANGVDPMLSQPLIAAFVPLGPVAHVVPNSIDLDSQIGPRAEEIDHEITRCVLLAETEAVGRTLQFAPQQDFGERHLTAQLFGALYRRCGFGRPSHPPSTTRLCRAVPLPIARRWGGFATFPILSIVLRWGGGSAKR